MASISSLNSTPQDEVAAFETQDKRHIFHFNDLPGEIKNIIYNYDIQNHGGLIAAGPVYESDAWNRYTNGDPDLVYSHPSGMLIIRPLPPQMRGDNFVSPVIGPPSPTAFTRLPRTFPALAQFSRKIRKEYLPLFFETTPLIVIGGITSCKAITGFFNLIGEGNIRRIKEVHLLDVAAEMGRIWWEAKESSDFDRYGPSPSSSGIGFYEVVDCVLQALKNIAHSLLELDPSTKLKMRNVDTRTNDYRGLSTLFEDPQLPALCLREWRVKPEGTFRMFQGTLASQMGVVMDFENTTIPVSAGEFRACLEVLAADSAY